MTENRENGRGSEKRERGVAARERGENARHVNARERATMLYQKTNYNKFRARAVYRGGTRKGINSRGLSADTTILKRIGLLSVPGGRAPKVQSPMTATKISLRTLSPLSVGIATRVSIRSALTAVIRELEHYRFLTFRNRGETRKILRIILDLL